MLTFTVDWTGTPDAKDILAASLIVAAENQRRAALTPPLSPLPFGTNQEKSASYKTALAVIVAAAHASYIQQGTEKSHGDRKHAYDAAPQNVKTSVDTALSPYFP